MDIVTVDFETEAIVDGTGKSPRPVGVAIWVPGSEPHYYSWGHPTGNNCTEDQAKQALHSVWDSPLLFHSAKFDIGVAMEHWGFPLPKRWDDTLFQIYLHNPLAKSVSLKPSAHSILGMPPDEQDVVADWVIAHGLTKSRTKAGAYICKVPAEIVSPYAIGDVVRTRRLHDHLYPELQERQWISAYERELRLTPLLSRAEKRGVRIDRERLFFDTQMFKVYFEHVNQALFAKLGSVFNPDSAAELVRALIKSGVPEHAFGRTPTGKVSTSRASLEGAVQDVQLLSLLRYRGALKTLLGTFMGPWLELSAHDGHLHPSWNQVRGDEYGTRTGRLSCAEPNLQNVPTEFEGMEVPGLPLLPFMRRYILPDEGEILVAADYNGQEMRLLAHFAEGRAAEIYRTDPRADFHEIARTILHDEAGLDLKRKLVKIVGFSLIYGAGVANLSEQLGLHYDQAKSIRRHYLNSIPGLEEFVNDVTSRPGVRTWGGRWIPKDKIEGKDWDFGYKLANHLIQGSAADQEKEAIIQYHELNPTGRFLMTVHDENVITSSPEDLKENVEKMKYAMESLPGFDVPFVAEVETGPNWHDLEKYNG